MTDRQNDGRTRVNLCHQPTKSVGSKNNEHWYDEDNIKTHNIYKKNISRQREVRNGDEGQIQYIGDHHH